MLKKEVKIIRNKETIEEETVFVQGFRRHEITIRKGVNHNTYKLQVRGTIDNESKYLYFDMPKDWLEELKIVIDEALKISQ